MGTAGGKIILCGEHAVVHGGDALVVGLDRGVVATATRDRTWQLLVDGRELEADDPTLEALRRVAAHLGSGPVRVSVSVTMPLGVGLGGSAAMGVAVARAIGELHGVPLSDADAFAAAQMWERVFHGNPSGVDAAAATYGGCLLYNRDDFAAAMTAGRPPERLRVSSALHIALAVAGPPSLTKAMVERVAQYKLADRTTFEATLHDIQTLVTQARVCVECGDLRQLGQLLSHNHELLSRWGLSTPAIERACELARLSGALGSKLTGAGGGGCVIALCEEHTGPAVLDAWRRAGYQTLTTSIPVTK